MHPDKIKEVMATIIPDISDRAFSDMRGQGSGPAEADTTADAVDTQFTWGKLSARVPLGGLIPKWHGAVRIDQSDETMITAFVPLNLIARVLWHALVFVKAGSLNVPMDPREAWHTGYLTGREEEKAQAPEDLKLQQAIAEAQFMQAEKVLTLFKGYQALHGQLTEFLIRTRDHSASEYEVDAPDDNALKAAYIGAFGPLPEPAYGEEQEP